MPLTPGAPVGDTIRELYHHGSRPRSREQIIAIAESNHRRGRAMGGLADATRLAPARNGLAGARHLAFGGDPSNSYMEHMALREAASESQYHPGGLIESDTSGRTDRLPMSVAADSFVVPADVIAGLGQGNTLAGARRMNEIIGSPAPYGAGAAPHRGGHSIPPPPHAAPDPGGSAPETGMGAMPRSLASAGSPYLAPGESGTITAPDQIAVPPVSNSSLITNMPTFSRGGHEPKSDVILAGGE